MQSTVTPDEADPHAIFVIEPSVLKEDRVALAARVEPPFADKPSQAPSPDKASLMPKAASPVEDIMGDILSRPSTPKLRVVPEVSVAAPRAPAKAAPPVDMKFRATAATADAIASQIKPPGEINIPDDIRVNGARRSRGAWARRVTFGFLFALCSAFAAEAWNHYGDTARELAAQWIPALTLPSSPPAATAAASPQPEQPAAQTATAPAAIADQTPSPPAPSAVQPARDDAATTTAAASPSAQQLQSMSQDMAAMSQQIEALKATIAQLKAGQEQMAQQIQHDVVRNAVARNVEAKPEPRTSEHPRVLGAPPRPLGPPLRKPPRAAYSPASTSAAMNVPPPYPAAPPVAAPYPTQPPVDSEAPDGGPVVRPPMPLH
jgi:hypothetical protein